MKKSIFLGSLAALAVCVACQNPKPADTVHLKGQLNVGANPVAMKYNGAASMLGDSRDILIRTDENGYFDTVISLSEPAYFDISRNTLYLTPGDDMTVYISQNNEDAVFQGVGAQANNYMKNLLHSTAVRICSRIWKAPASVPMCSTVTRHILYIQASAPDGLVWKMPKRKIRI